MRATKIRGDKSGSNLLRSPFAWFALLCGAALCAFSQSRPDTPEPQPLITSVSPSEAGNPCAQYLERSERAIAKQNFSTAIAEARDGLAGCTDQASLLLALARAQMLSRQFAAAEQSLRALLKKSPQDLSALILLGQVQYLDDHDMDAANSFQRAIAAAPQNPAPRYWLGRLDYQDGRISEAMNQLQAALQLAPGYYRAWDNLGLCYEALGQNGRAMENYVHALNLVYKDHPEYDSVYLNMSELLLKLGNNQKAFDLASEAASRNSGNPRSYFLAGNALVQAGKEDASLHWLLQAAKIDPAYPDPHYFMARVYRKEGKMADANRETEAFKKLQASAPHVRR